MNDWFQSAPISLEAWLRVIACGWLISLIVGAEKRLRSGNEEPQSTSDSNTNRVSESV